MTPQSVENFERDIAEGFVLYTNRNVFLTGKAGTGKTTFLHDVIKKTDKNSVIVAPTGVAAINAGGMTIHSMFQLPFNSFVPTNDWVNPDYFVNKTDLATKQKIRKERRKILMELDLLVIDEISMVRADLLDAVDFTLRRIRKNSNPFGGVQLLVIGDLFQLSPVVKNHEWNMIRTYYDSPFFFSSMAWRHSKAITIELKKIYRQQDDEFINILNNIRNGIKSQVDINRLNENFNHKANTTDIITLTTHNRKADAINQTELRKLDTKEQKLTASISGQFNESAYPTDERIVIKEGAQIMFIRNHPDQLYFNGKIGTIKSIKSTYITVKCEDSTYPIEIEPVEWKNTKYVLDESTNTIETKDVGAFTQYPIRLAWAVTVHKSQGLTFEKCIVDLEDTFAPGQLYVALSRCTSLDGLQLTSMIKEQNVIVDARIKSYFESSTIPDDVQDILQIAKNEYEDIVIKNAFFLSKEIDLIEDWRVDSIEGDVIGKANILILISDVQAKITSLQEIAKKFEYQLTLLMKDGKSKEAIFERSSKGIEYFTEEVYNNILLPIQTHREEYRIKAHTRKYVNELFTITTSLWAYLEKLYSLQHRGNSLYTDEPKYTQPTDSSGKPLKKAKKAKGETHKISLDLYKSGMTLEEISDARSLKVGTIKNHMVKWIREKEVKIEDFMTMDKVKKIWKYYEDNPESSSSEIKAKIPFEVDYADLSMVKAWAELMGKGE